MSLLCTTRFDRWLEEFRWNDGPDGSPSPYLLLKYQLDRLLSAANLVHFSIPPLFDYAALREICDDAVRDFVNGAADDETTLKVRVVLPSSGNISASASSVQALRTDPTAASRFNPDVDNHTQFDPILTVCLDTHSTSGTLSVKTTDRQPYDDARARVGIPPLGVSRSHNSTPSHPDDVILFNPEGVIMESSICNVAFHRHGSWFTPPLTVGCIAGVFRQWLLDNGHIHEADQHVISLDAIKNNEWILLFNGVSGCRLGRVTRSQ